MSEGVKKVYIQPEQERLDCWEMASIICNSVEQPFDLVIGITRGGAPIAFYIQEFMLKFWGKDVGFATLRTRSYDAVGSAGRVEIGSLQEVEEELGKGRRVLLVDDIFDRGKTIEATLKALYASFEQIEHISIATLYYKPENSVVDVVPDYFLREYKGNEWVVFPHSISDLDTPEELAAFGVPAKFIDCLQG